MCLRYFDAGLNGCSNAVCGNCVRYGTVLTEQERRMLSENRFSDLTQYQRRLDAEIDAQVRFAY